MADSMFTIKVDTSNLNELTQKVKKITNDISLVAVNISNHIYSDIQQNFDSLGRHDGTSSVLGGGIQRWQPLSEATKKHYKQLAKKDSRYSNLNPTLRRTDSLYNSIKVDYKNLATLTRINISAGTDYGAVHQFGHKKIPARPYLNINDVQGIYDIIIEYLNWRLSVI